MDLEEFLEETVLESSVEKSGDMQETVRGSPLDISDPSPESDEEPLVPLADGHTMAVLGGLSGGGQRLGDDPLLLRDPSPDGQSLFGHLTPKASGKKATATSPGRELGSPPAGQPTPKRSPTSPALSFLRDDVYSMVVVDSDEDVDEDVDEFFEVMFPKLRSPPMKKVKT